MDFRRGYQFAERKLNESERMVQNIKEILR